MLDPSAPGSELAVAWFRFWRRRTVPPARPVYPFVMDPYADHPKHCKCPWHR